jgi:ABC-type nitrate/sulfonate/bicarbonate transport system substrate-binding protein
LRSYTAAVRDYPHTTALKAGERVPATCRLEFEDVEPIHRAFAPMVRELRFDFCELALVTYLQAREAGKEISALPIVLHGNFHHRSLSRLPDGPIRQPKDLAGQRVGVRAYTQTVGLWVRGALAEEYGVDCDEITWVTTEEPHVLEYTEPANVRRGSGSLFEMLRTGEITALVMGPKAFPADAELEPLIEDWRGAQQAWYERHSTVPINHLLTVRTDVLRNDPRAVRDVYDAFAAQIDATHGADPAQGPRRISHGLNAGLIGSLRLAIRYAAHQHLIKTEPSVEEIFADFQRCVDTR